MMQNKMEIGNSEGIVIGICDDESEVANALKILVNNVLKEWNFEHKIVMFNSGNEFLKNAKDVDLVFLDIEMPQKDGIAVGDEIRKKNPCCKIIMATGKFDRFKDAFKINALRYVTKPFQTDEIIEALESYFNSRLGENWIEAYMNRNIRKIKQNEIIYLRAMDSYTELVTGKFTLRTEKSMSELESELDDRLFCRIHKQYIINFSDIDEINKDIVTIKGKKMRVSRRKKGEFEKKYLEFDIKYR